MIELPKFKGYTIDDRLKEFRKVRRGKNPDIEFIPYHSPKGQELLKEMEERHTNKIRGRVTYQEFKSHLNFLRKNPSHAEILKRIHQIIDGRHGYHSETNSNYARESLELIIADNNLN